MQQCAAQIASAPSAFGHKRTFAVQWMSALPPIADMCSATRDVRFVPIADIAAVISTSSISLGRHAFVKNGSSGL